jgi:hypothetical protein
MFDLGAAAKWDQKQVGPVLFKAEVDSGLFFDAQINIMNLFSIDWGRNNS